MQQKRFKYGRLDEIEEMSQKSQTNADGRAA
jgi:hypothetical protein